MSSKQRKPFTVKASKLPVVTDEDIKQKYGWSKGKGFIKTPDFSFSEISLVLLSLAGLVFLGIFGGFNYLNLSALIANIAAPTWVAGLGLGAILLIFTELYYEFLVIRGQFSKPTFSEVFVGKFYALMGGIMTLIIYPILLVLMVLFVFVYANYARTVSQRKKNFEVYLQAKKEEIAENTALPVKEQKEISYNTADLSVDVVSPDEDISEEV